MVDLNGKHGQGTHSTKMGADKLAEKTPNAPQNFRPNLSTQDQKFGIFKKSSLRSPCFEPMKKESCSQNCQVVVSLTVVQFSDAGNFEVTGNPRFTLLMWGPKRKTTETKTA